MSLNGNLRHRRLVLASSSPRRRELMTALARDVEVVSPGGHEPDRSDAVSPDEYVMRLSQSKAQQVAVRLENAVVVGADTEVVLDNDVLGKPSDAHEAAEMLIRLRARPHRVVTGVTVLDSVTGRWLTSSKSTEVRMRAYSDHEMDAYIATGDPMDKAGAYAVQDPVFRPAEMVSGCYLNVVGLPLCEVRRLVEDLGLPVQGKERWQMPEECRDCGVAQENEVALS